MELQALLDHLNAGGDLVWGTEMNTCMTDHSQETIKLCAQMNMGPHSLEELRDLMSRIVGHELDPDFRVFPPFHSDFGKNIHFGKNVFVNSCCCFQDQGGIFIGDDVLIGHRVTFATLNHDFDPEKRHILHCKPIHVGNKVWIGSCATILAGVTIGDGAVVAAGALVTKDVPPRTIVAGLPARVVRTVDGAMIQNAR